MKQRFLLFILFLILTSCGQKSQYFSPPIFLGIEKITHNSLTLHFDRPVHLSNIVLYSPLTLESVDKNTLFFGNAHVAQPYTLEATASVGVSSLDFSLTFYGIPAEEPIPLVINELSIIHNKKITDAIELRALATGNLAGTTVYLGTPQNYRARYIFADHQVKEGDLLVLHADIPAPFTFDNSPKLGNTREVITIATNPYAPAYFGLAYEKASASETNSSQRQLFLQQWQYLLDQQLWQGDPIDIQYVTATRSLNRRRVPLELPESAVHWYVTGTSGNSIGKTNNPKVHQPKPKK
ncbi:hypothetical protein [Entomospira culicis]|uniref:TP-1001-like C-terminal domain-containing protein n=1 Tax=Entomospira culicis TaxID=2719989 RepID=A0A968GG57_9SPIO|nr:hypothetical protein [Entomospira culicis]NIZ19742.1 hypothetical protein [Entomospira culicis]NIZ69956.1 hypothetical protein [Entomospira culicis]WDI37061.1 hypothetical protein PVA46_07005 [Entomospira culicis]WDI38690.1 hypothetical protein PVA47_07015 [Entomospira culicis]